MTTREPSAQPRLAAIDVGTNTIRLIVAEVQDDDTYRILDEEREMVRLGEKLDRTGRLSDAAVERALEAIGKMKAIADGFAVTEVRAIATSAVREAANGRGFVREVMRQHRLRIEVISGEEEAQLAFRSAARHFDLEGRSTAVVDIGGGSVEVILSAGAAIDQVYSLPLGAVRVTERLVRSDPLRNKHWKAMKAEIDRSIREAIHQPAHRAEIMIGSGGTFTALAHMSKWEREGRHGSVQGYVLTPAEVIHLLDRLREAPLEARRQIPGLSSDRADIIVAGASVISRLMRRLGSQRILVNERGIRDGLLLHMISELPGRSAARAASPGRQPHGVGPPPGPQVPVERAALRAGRHPGSADLRRRQESLRAACPQPGRAAGCRSVARHRLSDQSLQASQARLPPDHARGSARVLSPRGRAHRQRGAIPSPGLSQEVVT